MNSFGGNILSIISSIYFLHAETADFKEDVLLKSPGLLSVLPSSNFQALSKSAEMC